MAATCYSLVRGRVARLTRVDECCRPVCGERAFLTTEGVIDVEYAFNLKEQEEIEVENFAGNICVSDTTCPELKWIDVTIQLCQVDPDALELMTGQRRILDFAGTANGTRVGETIRCDGGFSLEVWAGTPDADCDDFGDPLPNYGYLLLPCIINGILGDFTIANDVATFSVTGRTKRGTGWGVGPFDVVPQDITGTPGPLLDAWLVTEHLHMQLTTVPPPEAVCGAQDGPQISVVVTTDANNDGTFSANEVAPCANQDVPVQIVITNNGTEATTLSAVSLTDGTATYDVDAGDSAFTGGTLGSLAQGASTTYTGTLTGWSPTNNNRKALIATVTHQGDTSTMRCDDRGTDSIATLQASGSAAFLNGAAQFTGCPNPTQWAATGANAAFPQFATVNEGICANGGLQRTDATGVFVTYDVPGAAGQSFSAEANWTFSDADTLPDRNLLDVLAGGNRVGIFYLTQAGGGDSTLGMAAGASLVQQGTLTTVVAGQTYNMKLVYDADAGTITGFVDNVQVYTEAIAAPTACAVINTVIGHNAAGTVLADAGATDTVLSWGITIGSTTDAL